MKKTKTREIDFNCNPKSFIGPHFDYGDIAYDRAFNESFHKNLDSIQ